MDTKSGYTRLFLCCRRAESFCLVSLSMFNGWKSLALLWVTLKREFIYIFKLLVHVIRRVLITKSKKYEVMSSIDWHCWTEFLAMSLSVTYELKVLMWEYGGQKNLNASKCGGWQVISGDLTRFGRACKTATMRKIARRWTIKLVTENEKREENKRNVFGSDFREIVSIVYL